MDEDGIGLVLARATELRSKITTYVRKSSTFAEDSKEDELGNGEKDDLSRSLAEPDQEEEEEDEETESLLNIRDGLESLEAQLSSLQALQQQQWYEREAALAEIDYSRKKLLKMLSDYKGEDLEVIQEAAAFASSAVEDQNDLLLPPYPSRPPFSLVSESGIFSIFASKRSVQNGAINGEATIDMNGPHESGRHKVKSGPQNAFKGLRCFINTAAKTVLTVVSVISVLRLAGFETRLRKNDSHLNILSLFQPHEAEVKGGEVHCPPGKILVMENGEIRCLVKERVEVPFESVVAMPNVNYGCG